MHSVHTGEKVSSIVRTPRVYGLAEHCEKKTARKGSEAFPAGLADLSSHQPHATADPPRWCVFALRPAQPCFSRASAGCAQEARGVDVSGYRWRDSGHVQHFRQHPQEYAYQVSAFLARALKDW